MKIVVTTSDNYHHLLKIFIYLFNKNWPIVQEVEIVGYKVPEFELPSNFKFHSMGVQTGTNKDFTNDLKKYFENQSDWFIWLFEDSFIKSVDYNKLYALKKLVYFNDVGRVNLTRECLKQDNTFFANIDDYDVYENTQTANYRLSTQPSIWKRDFLLQYLKPNLSPWDFETQESVNDGWKIFGMADGPIDHNEGVNKRDIYKYDLSGIKEEQIVEMKLLKLIP